MLFKTWDEQKIYFKYIAPMIVVIMVLFYFSFMFFSTNLVKDEQLKNMKAVIDNIAEQNNKNRNDLNECRQELIKKESDIKSIEDILANAFYKIDE